MNMGLCTVREILPDYPVNSIMVRTNHPFYDDENGLLVGYCSWDGESLIPLDGDIYRLDEIVYKYEWEEDGSLTYWILSNWYKGSDSESGTG